MTALIRIDRSWTPTGNGRPKPIRFCTRCGHPNDEPPGRPGDAAAFVICTYDLYVSAVSQAGERIFGKEERLVGSHLLDLVTSPLGDDQLARHAGIAAQRPVDPVVMPLRLTSGPGKARVGTLAGRISTCGPPRAVLLTVEPSEFGRR